jgi:poly-gamma-glutamate capsule biosynthesis protein CapA/YwtB (metallophosphatase superfamily)
MAGTGGRGNEPASAVLDRVFHGTVKRYFVLSGIIIGMLLLVVVSLTPAGHSFKLAATGDIMLGRGVASAHADGSWGQALAALSPYLAASDLAFANLESPITNANLARVTYDLRAPPQAKLALSTSGIDLVSLANNHSGDSGLIGLTDTLQSLESVEIASVGLDEDPLLIQSNGIRLAWFAFNDLAQALDLMRVRDALLDVRSHVDLVIVSIHWGKEFASIPSERQHLLAQQLSAAGADIILGHHPHVLQPVEWVWGLGRGRPTLVAYSLGNALFDQSAPPTARFGALLMMSVDRLGVQEACVIPFQLNPTIWNTMLASASTSEAVLRRVQMKSCQPQ